MVNALTRLVPVNAIYFKGDWASKFHPNATKEKDFRLSDGKSTKKVQMMRKPKKFQWAQLKDLGASMLELPFKGDMVVMQILLPDAVQGLGTMEDCLRTTDLEQLFRDAVSDRLVALELPKFSNLNLGSSKATNQSKQLSTRAGNERYL